MIKYYSKNVYQAIADTYTLGKIEEITHLYRGYGGSAKVKITTPKGAFVVSKNILSNIKDGTSKSVTSLQYEIDMLSLVKDMKVPVFCRSVHKKYIEKVKDAYVTVYHFIPGKSPKKITQKMAFELGTFLGEFHTRTKKFKKELPSRRRFYDLNPRIMKMMKPVAENQKNKILKSLVKEIEEGVIQNTPVVNLPVGPIHVDIGHNNELWQGNRLSGIIDFGNFYRGPFMIDIGKTIMWNCCENGKVKRKLLKSFLDGYKSKRSLNKQEEVYIEKSILYAIYSHIWVDMYHVPIKYVPESWPLFLIKTFMPVVKELKKNGI